MSAPSRHTDTYTYMYIHEQQLYTNREGEGERGEGRGREGRGGGERGGRSLQGLMLTHLCFSRAHSLLLEMRELRVRGSSRRWNTAWRSHDVT